jgi:hypothetical protein
MDPDAPEVVPGFDFDARRASSEADAGTFAWFSVLLAFS